MYFPPEGFGIVPPLGFLIHGAMSRPRNPVARVLADRLFHHRLVPAKLPLGPTLAEWDDLDGAVLDVVEEFRRTGLIEDEE